MSMQSWIQLGNLAFLNDGFNCEVTFRIWLQDGSPLLQKYRETHSLKPDCKYILKLKAMR